MEMPSIVSIALRLEVVKPSPNCINDLADRLARLHSEGPNAFDEWIEALTWAEEKGGQPISTLPIKTGHRPTEEDLLAAPILKLIAPACERFLERRAEGKWDSIKASERNADRELDYISPDSPRTLLACKSGKYGDRKWAALRMVRNGLPFPEDEEGVALVELIQEALFRDMNKGSARFNEKTRKFDGVLKPPQVGDAKFFRELADAMESQKSLKTARFIAQSWAQPIFQISVYPFCFWTDAAIADFVNAIVFKDEGAWISSRAVKNHRDRLGLQKAPKIYVNEVYSDLSKGMFSVGYYPTPKKNRPLRSKAQ